MKRHEFANSDITKFDSNCTVCGGKDRDAIHHTGYFRHVNFTGKRTEYECTQIAGCISDVMPNHHFVRCQPEELMGTQQLYVESGVRYMGWL